MIMAPTRSFDRDTHTHTCMVSNAILGLLHGFRIGKHHPLHFCLFTRRMIRRRQDSLASSTGVRGRSRRATFKGRASAVMAYAAENGSGYCLGVRNLVWGGVFCFFSGKGESAQKLGVLYIFAF